MEIHMQAVVNNLNSILALDDKEILKEVRHQKMMKFLNQLHLTFNYSNIHIHIRFVKQL